MGALAESYINKPVNTTSGWAGMGQLGETVDTKVFKPVTVESVKQQAVNNISTKALSSSASRLNHWAFGAKTIYDLGVALKDGYDSGNLKIPDALVDLFSSADFTMQQQDALNEQLNGFLPSDSVPVGETLPSVLKQNAKAIIQALNAYTSVFNLKLDELNYSFAGLLSYMENIASLMQKTYDDNKKLQELKAKEEEQNTVQVGDTKMTPAEIEAKKNLAMWRAYDFKTSAVSSSVLEASNVAGMTPLEIEVSKNSYIVEANEFAKSPVDYDILNSDSVVGMSPREIEISHRSNEVEAKVYARTATTVKDWDENVLADIAPREAELVKNTTLAKDTTDKINFSLDDDGGIDEIVNGIDLPSIFGYSGDTEALKEFYERLGGQGL